jgi:hypothetical protein
MNQNAEQPKKGAERISAELEKFTPTYELNLPTVKQLFDPKNMANMLAVMDTKVDGTTYTVAQLIKKGAELYFFNPSSGISDPTQKMETLEKAMDHLRNAKAFDFQKGYSVGKFVEQYIYGKRHLGEKLMGKKEYSNKGIREMRQDFETAIRTPDMDSAIPEKMGSRKEYTKNGLIKESKEETELGDIKNNIKVLKDYIITLPEDTDENTLNGISQRLNALENGKKRLEAEIKRGKEEKENITNTIAASFFDDTTTTINNRDMSRANSALLSLIGKSKTGANDVEFNSIELGGCDTMPAKQLLSQKIMELSKNNPKNKGINAYLSPDDIADIAVWGSMVNSEIDEKVKIGKTGLQRLSILIDSMPIGESVGEDRELNQEDEEPTAQQKQERQQKEERNENKRKLKEYLLVALFTKAVDYSINSSIAQTNSMKKNAGLTPINALQILESKTEGKMAGGMTNMPNNSEDKEKAKKNSWLKGMATWGLRIGAVGASFAAPLMINASNESANFKNAKVGEINMTLQEYNRNIDTYKAKYGEENIAVQYLKTANNAREGGTFVTLRIPAHLVDTSSEIGVQETNLYSPEAGYSPDIFSKKFDPETKQMKPDAQTMKFTPKNYEGSGGVPLIPIYIAEGTALIAIGTYWLKKRNQSN